MKSTMHERLITFLDHLGIKPSKFEAKMGFSSSSFVRPLKKGLPISSDRLQMIFLKYSWLNPSWLFNGEGPMDIRTKPESSPGPGIPNASGLIEQIINNAPEDLRSDLNELKKHILVIMDSNAGLNQKLIKSYESRDKIIKILEKRL